MKNAHTRIACVIVATLFSIFGILSTVGQKSGEANEFPTTCEDAIYRVAMALQRNASRKNEKAIFFAVGRAGFQEKGSISERRLLRLKDHLSLLKPNFAISTLQGDLTSGLGRIEFYVDGVFADQILFRKNQLVDLNRCSIP